MLKDLMLLNYCKDKLEKEFNFQICNITFSKTYTSFFMDRNLLANTAWLALRTFS